MTTIKTADLTGPALDWAVAKAEGASAHHLLGYSYEVDWRNRRAKRFSTDWSQGGPIIERERIAIDYDHDIWNAAKLGLHWFIGGPTALVAAMRCLVKSKLGDTVDVPEDLLS